jgi:hypothetical protein
MGKTVKKLAFALSARERRAAEEEAPAESGANVGGRGPTLKENGGCALAFRVGVNFFSFVAHQKRLAGVDVFFGFRFASER